MDPKMNYKEIASEALMDSRQAAQAGDDMWAANWAQALAAQAQAAAILALVEIVEKQLYKD